jgi:DNA-binding transcriptional ArsR family regulator
MNTPMKDEYDQHYPDELRETIWNSTTGRVDYLLLEYLLSTCFRLNTRVCDFDIARFAEKYEISRAAIRSHLLKLSERGLILSEGMIRREGYRSYRWWSVPLYDRFMTSKKEGKGKDLDRGKPCH